MAEQKKSKQEKQYTIDFKYNFKIYGALLKKYKGMIIALLVLILLLETAYLSDRFLFKLVIDNTTNFVAKTTSQQALISTLGIIAAVFVSIALLRAIMRWVHMHLINVLDAKLMLDIKKQFLNHLVNLSYNFHTSHKTGSLISKLIRSAGAVERMTDTVVFNFVPLLFQTIIASTMIIYFYPVAAITILSIVIVFIGYSLFINKKLQHANIMANEAEDYEKAIISDIFTNIESIKYFGKEKNIQNKYYGIGQKTRQAMMKHLNYFRTLSVGHGLILSTGVFLIIYFPLTQVIAGKMTIGTLVFVYTTFTALLGNLFGFDHGIRNFYRSMADFDSLFQYYKIQNDIKDLPNAKKLKINEGTIEFCDVSFAYKKRKIICDFSLKIPRNKKIALVGPSGSGKSTIVRLLYRLYDTNKGEILIDGENINKIQQESLRSELSIVPQECVLFDDTIYNNIAFSNPEATRAEVFKAIKFAQLDKIITDFPEKEKTIVGERGVKLSGGEKQRVSIARAILANKKILVLDEATSSLDSETEHEIQRDMARLLQGRTSIIIAHRLSTIMSADQIIVIDKGRIVQTGSHNELIRKEGMYRKLWNLQKGGYIE